jgi:hypothetical protein
MLVPADRINGDFVSLQQNVGELGKALAANDTQAAHKLIADTVAALDRIDRRIGGIERTVTEQGKRIGAIERHIHPPWVVTFWRVCAVLAFMAGLTAAAKWPQVLFELYLPIGIIVEAAFIGLATVCVLQANAQLERDT